MTTSMHAKQEPRGTCSNTRISRHFLPLLLLMALFILPGKKAMAGPPNGDPVHIFVTTDPDNYIDGTFCKGYFGGYVKLAGNFTAPWNYCTNLSGTIYLDKLISGNWVQQKSVSFSNVASEAYFNFPITNVPIQDWFKVRVHFTAATYLGTPLVEPSAGSNPDWYGETNGKETTGSGYCCLVAPTGPAPNASFTLGGYGVSASGPGTDIDYLAPCLLNMVLNSSHNAVEYQLKINGPYPYPGPVTVYTTDWASIPGNRVIDIQTALLNTIGTVAGWREIRLIVKDDCERTSSATVLCTIYDPDPTATVGFTVNSVNISPGTHLDVYTCDPITLANTTTISTPGWPYTYSLTLTKTDASGVPLAAPNAYSETVNVSSFPLDMKNLPSPISTRLANDANAGYYKVKLQVANSCGGSPFTKESLINLSGPPPLSTVLSISTYDSGMPVLVTGTTESTPQDICVSDGYPAFRCANTVGSVVSSYRRSTWQKTGGVWVEVNTAVTKTVASLADVKGAMISAGQTVPDNTVIKFKLELYNVCVSSPLVKEEYFRMIPTCKKGNKPEATGVSDKDVQDQLISIYPNPAKDFLQLDGLANGVHVEVFDIKGKSVLTKAATSSSMQLDLHALNKGMYMLRVIDAFSGEEIHTSRFVKE